MGSTSLLQEGRTAPSTCGLSTQSASPAVCACFLRNIVIYYTVHWRQLLCWEELGFLPSMPCWKEAGRASSLRNLKNTSTTPRLEGIHYAVSTEGGSMWNVLLSPHSQGPDSMNTREVSTTVPIGQIPYIMRAIGFYPSEQEVWYLLIGSVVLVVYTMLLCMVCM